MKKYWHSAVVISGTQAHGIDTESLRQYFCLFDFIIIRLHQNPIFFNISDTAPELSMNKIVSAVLSQKLRGSNKKVAE